MEYRPRCLPECRYRQIVYTTINDLGFHAKNPVLACTLKNPEGKPKHPVNVMLDWFPNHWFGYNLRLVARHGLGLCFYSDLVPTEDDIARVCRYSYQIPDIPQKCPDVLLFTKTEKLLDKLGRILDLIFSDGRRPKRYIGE
ncbi:MAG: hypothetical protein COV63_00545 [Candidatus Nealsonbacteria bacterium CG11_big_fil_rev_8_21_14_0_20_37_68]|nr:MAG: hypothetical protein COV63_00545 [Candidatus Nealsonbacteria bacterium CG11_big_fil_rev_8_21_14_0_20_37_68]